ncbi:MAG TPA: class I SAM-dependent methyltransferase [Thermoplasmata archaeon]|nr:class I SAM-dependent methyltransferase [Thermoplasmata archaeon]
MSFFEGVYRQGRPPWDIGRPQGAVLELIAAGALRPPVLDLGCGTGENALACAASGLAVRGIDGAPTAIERARDKAKARDLAAQFDVGDALALEVPSGSVATVLDCGLFHTFDDADRLRYSASLHRVLRPRGRAYILCFSDSEPNWGGPRRVPASEIGPVFGDRFAVAEIVPSRFETNDPAITGHALRIRLDRRAGPPARKSPK